MMAFENILGVLTLVTLVFGGYVFVRAARDITRMLKARAQNAIRKNGHAMHV